ncbi:MAG: hypothetical protein JOY71_11285 [Acetobacteraceae bacterium]|nr:hypothetical protein [Acetobacteraceae bacterium]MBV8522687.1 hypothetical protein [Acetobacteraceae bacterium]
MRAAVVVEAGQRNKLFGEDRIVFVPWFLPLQRFHGAYSAYASFLNVARGPSDIELE